MAFATPEQLRLHLGLATIDITRANYHLERASTAVRSAAEVSIEQASGDTTLSGNGRRVLLLPEYPVTAVSAVTVDGQTLDDAAYTWSRAGVLERTGGVWPDKPRSVTVSYTHGYLAAEIPEEIATVTVDVAARSWGNPTDERQESIGSYTARHESGIRLTKDEAEMVRRAIR